MGHYSKFHNRVNMARSISSRGFCFYSSNPTFRKRTVTTLHIKCFTSWDRTTPDVKHRRSTYSPGHAMQGPEFAWSTLRVPRPTTWMCAAACRSRKTKEGWTSETEPNIGCRTTDHPNILVLVFDFKPVKTRIIVIYSCTELRKQACKRSRKQE